MIAVDASSPRERGHQNAPRIRSALPRRGLALAAALLLAFWALLALPSRALGAPAAGDLQERIAQIRQDAAPQLPEYGAREALIARTTLLLVSRYHVQQPRMTPAMSSRWFQAYFELLDPSKIYFLLSDLEEFRAAEGKMWDRQLNVNLRFAFAVYRRLLERMRQWALYSIEALDQPQDFTIQEGIPLNVKTAELEWCASVQEQRDRWRKRVKNTLLADALREEREQSRRSSATAAAATPSRQDAMTRNKKLVVSSYQYRRRANANEILGYYLNALLGLCDPHTNYLTPADKKNFDIHMSNSLQGAGFVLSQRDFFTTIVEIIPGGPAARDGRLKPGDRILAVGQADDQEPEDVADMPLDEVVERIRGPKGTPVLLTITHQGSATESMVRLIRDEIVLKDAEPQSTIHQVETANGQARILQIYVPSYYCDLKSKAENSADYRSTTMDVRRLLLAAQAEGPVDGIVLDLRGNGGGYLDEACSLSGLFVDGGPVVQVKMGDDVEVLSAPAPGKALYSGPLAVLVDKMSASASEITAACLQDRGRAIVCGDATTHGKGSVQMPLDLQSVPLISANAKLLGRDAEGRVRHPGTLKITNGRFYRVNGVSTQAIGVVPDIVFPSFTEQLDTGEASLPNVLPSDTIPGVKCQVAAGLGPLKPELRARAQRFMQTDPGFLKYAAEVERYRRLRQIKVLPLEINARRAFQNEERECLRQFRHYQPERNRDGEKRERLKDEGDEDEDEDNAPKEDVVLAATLEVMGWLCRRQ